MWQYFTPRKLFIGPSPALAATFAPTTPLGILGAHAPCPTEGTMQASLLRATGLQTDAALALCRLNDTGHQNGQTSLVAGIPREDIVLGLSAMSLDETTRAANSSLVPGEIF